MRYTTVFATCACLVAARYQLDLAHGEGDLQRDAQVTQPAKAANTGKAGKALSIPVLASRTSVPTAGTRATPSLNMITGTGPLSKSTAIPVVAATATASSNVKPMPPGLLVPQVTKQTTSTPTMAMTITMAITSYETRSAMTTGSSAGSRPEAMLATPTAATHTATMAALSTPTIDVIEVVGATSATPHATMRLPTETGKSKNAGDRGEVSVTMMATLCVFVMVGYLFL